MAKTPMPWSKTREGAKSALWQAQDGHAGLQFDIQRGVLTDNLYVLTVYPLGDSAAAPLGTKSARTMAEVKRKAEGYRREYRLGRLLNPEAWDEGRSVRQVDYTSNIGLVLVDVAVNGPLKKGDIGPLGGLTYETHALIRQGLLKQRKEAPYTITITPRGLTVLHDTYPGAVSYFQRMHREDPDNHGPVPGPPARKNPRKRQRKKAARYQAFLFYAEENETAPIGTFSTLPRARAAVDKWVSQSSGWTPWGGVYKGKKLVYEKKWAKGNPTGDDADMQLNDVEGAEAFLERARSLGRSDPDGAIDLATSAIRAVHGRRRYFTASVGRRASEVDYAAEKYIREIYKECLRKANPTMSRAEMREFWSRAADERIAEAMGFEDVYEWQEWKDAVAASKKRKEKGQQSNPRRAQRKKKPRKTTTAQARAILSRAMRGT